MAADPTADRWGKMGTMIAPNEMKWKQMDVSQKFLPRRECETGEFFNKNIMGDKLSAPFRTRGSQCSSVTKDHQHQNVQDCSIGCQNHGHNSLGC